MKAVKQWGMPCWRTKYSPNLICLLTEYTRRQCPASWEDLRKTLVSLISMYVYYINMIVRVGIPKAYTGSDRYINWWLGSTGAVLVTNKLNIKQALAYAQVLSYVWNYTTDGFVFQFIHIEFASELRYDHLVVYVPLQLSNNPLDHPASMCLNAASLTEDGRFESQGVRHMGECHRCECYCNQEHAKRNFNYLFLAHKRRCPLILN